MNRNDLAKELGVWPWKVDDWLLRGCPAKKLGKTWEFNVGKVRLWLESEKIKVRGKKPSSSTRPTFNARWFRAHCPICIDRGFLGEKAGRVYTLGEVVDGEWHLRRTGIPCGHSAYLPVRTGKGKDDLRVPESSELIVNRKRILESLAAPHDLRKAKIAMLKKAIVEGTYRIKFDDTAMKILEDLVLQRALGPRG